MKADVSELSTATGTSSTLPTFHGKYISDINTLWVLGYIYRDVTWWHQEFNKVQKMEFSCDGDHCLNIKKKVISEFILRFK